MHRSLAVFAFAWFAVAAHAQVTVPFTFGPGTPARAAEVNSNFQALVTAVNNLGARVSKLEGQITAADIAGVYKWSGLQIGLIVGGTVESISYSGTVTLAADGTFTGTLAGRGFDLFPGGNRLPHTTNDNIAGTWTLSGSNTVTLTGLGDDPATFDSAARGQMLVFSNKDNSHADGSLVLLILVRSSLFN
jgi:hypothetical protein